MRQIKFRAWDKKRKVIFAVNSFDMDTPKITISPLRIEGEGIDDLTYKRVKDCILMQFTGLKDKNGKEIYEGDIVIDSRDGEKYIVNWVQHTVGFWGEKRGKSSNLLGEMEVIGNIYENPELANGGAIKKT